MSKLLIDYQFVVATHRGLPLTSARFDRLISYFSGDWERIFYASQKNLLQAGIDPKGIQKFLSIRDNINPKIEIEKLEKISAKVLLKGESSYPVSLQNIPQSPSILFLRGQLYESDFPSISVVGSRNISAYGARVTKYVVGPIARQGITIVSGLAYGVDKLAHDTALECGARTICVLGNAIGDIYPHKHKIFAKNLIEQNRGAIISEYLPETPSRAEFFPIRNRIISGISAGTIIIEGGIKSGSLITARLANDQGREVFGVPGDIFSPTSAGVNQLISQGEVAPITRGEEVIEALGFSNTRTTLPLVETKKTMLQPSDEEQAILQCFHGSIPLHPNTIACQTNLPISQINSLLPILELKGWIENINEQEYMKVV